MAGDVSIRITGDSSDLRAELKKVEKNLDAVTDGVQGMANQARKGFDKLGKSTGGAAKQVRDWDQKLVGAGGSAKGAANNNQNFASSLDGVKDSAGETASIMGGLATSLTVISPQAGAAARMLGDLATGVEAASRGGSRLFAILGPVAVAVAALGAAYIAMKGDLDDANAALKVQRERLEDVESMSRKVKEAVLIQAHAELQAAKARNEATQSQVDAAAAALDEMAIAQSSLDLFGARREALTAESDAIKEKIDALKEAENEENKAADSSRALTSAMAGGMMGGAALAASMRVVAAETSGNSEEMEKLEHQLTLANTRVENLSAASERYEGALKGTKQANKDAAAATESNSKAQQNQTAATTEAAAALASLQQISIGAHVSQLSDRQKIIHSYGQEITAIDVLAKKHEDSAAIQDAADAARHNKKIETQAQLDALDAQYVEAQKQRQQELHAQSMQLAQSSIGGAGALASNLGGIYGEIAKDKAKTDKAGAMKAFRTQKALSSASVMLQFGEGIMAAQKLVAPLNFIQMGVATAGMALAMMQISSAKPPFHSGSGFVRAPSGVNEMNARLRDGEAVSTPLGAELIGRGTIERANAGIGPGGGSGGVAFQYEHRVFSRFIRDNVRTRGPLGREQDRKIKVGHRRS